MKDDKVDDLFQRRRNSAERIGYIVAVDLSGEGRGFQFLLDAFYILTIVPRWPDQRSGMYKAG